MPEKSKILMLSTAYLPLIGGSELAIKNITDRLNNFEFHLITGRYLRKLPAYEKIGNVHVYRVGGRLSTVNIFLPKILLPFEIFLKAASLLRKNKYILIHAFQASQAAGGGWLLKLFYPRLPMILTIQEGKELDSQGVLITFFRRLIFKKINAVTAISRYLGEYIKKTRKDLPVLIIPNGVNMENFSGSLSYGDLTALAQSLGLKADEKVILTVSRFVPKNGLDILISAARILNAQCPGLKYKILLVGNGSSRKDLQKLALDLGVKDKIVFSGEVKHEDVPRFLKISHVFVRPSRSEGLGTAFLEAMAAGIPVIGTPVGGIPDFITDRETGLFCRLNDPADLAKKIQEIIEDNRLRTHLSENGQRLVAEKYDWDSIAGRFRALYESVS